MTDKKPVLLSDTRAWLMKYFAPIITTFVSTTWYFESKSYNLPVVLFILGQFYWFFRLRQLKEVKLDGEYLLISSTFKKDKIHINDIESITTGGWAMYLTTMRFKRQTVFGQKIAFSTMQSGFGIGISDKVRDILKTLKPENV